MRGIVEFLIEPVLSLNCVDMPVLAIRKSAAPQEHILERIGEQIADLTVLLNLVDVAEQSQQRTVGHVVDNPAQIVEHVKPQVVLQEMV